MDSQIAIHFLENERAKFEVFEVWNRELERRSLLHTAVLLRRILNQQNHIEGQTTKETKEKNTVKQDMVKIQHEKKLLENKVSLLTSEIENWKKKSSNQVALQKETITQKNQITKLNSQLNEAKNEVNKVKQQFATQKAVLESKLENAKKNIKNLKDTKNGGVSSQGKIPNPLLSPSKPTFNNKEQLPLKKPLVSNFSVSPFLAKTSKGPSSPSKEPKAHPLSHVASSTPTQIAIKNVLAQSTPGNSQVSPLRNMKSQTAKSSGLKNLLSPVKDSNKPSKPKKSLFDVDDDEDEDLFGDSIKKVKKEAKEKENDKESGDSDTVKINEPVDNAAKKKKRKIGGKAIIEEEEDEVVKFSPLKKVKLMDKLGGISPLKQRNKERNLFKV